MDIKKTVTVWFEHPETYDEIELLVTFAYSYDPGRMYMPNGDPGYPPEESFDIEHVSLVNSNDNVPEWITYEMIEQELVNSGHLDNDYDYEEYDESYEED